MSNHGLTAEDYKHLRYIHKNGTKAYQANGHDPDAVKLTCHHCKYTWRYSGEKARASCPQCNRKTKTGLGPVKEDGRGITLPMCNAIRAAADDGKTYREIADLFGFINDATAAYRHATGKCSHGRVDYPPIPSHRDPGPPEGIVSPAECHQLRAALHSGAFLSWRDAASFGDVSMSTARRHLTDGCSHDGRLSTAPPDLSPEDIKQRRKASGFATQQALADAIGVAKTTVGGWESGENALRPCVAFALNAVLDDTG